MAINIEDLEYLLGKENVDKETKIKVLKAAEELEQEKKNERESKAKKNKSQFVVVLKGVEVTEDIVAHVFTTPQDFDNSLLLDKVRTAAATQNAGAKQKRSKVEGFDDVTAIKRKFLKPDGILLKTKEDWVRAIVLPKDFSFVTTPPDETSTGPK